MDSPATRPTPEDMLRAEELLDEAPWAFLSVVDVDVPYVVPMNFAYVPKRPAADSPGEDGSPPEVTGSLGRIILHTGAGRKARALAGNPRVCLAVVSGADFTEGATPCRHGFNYRSVLAEGRATLLEEVVEREQALRELVAKYDPSAKEVSFEGDVFTRTLVYAIEIESLAYRARPRST